MTPQRCIGGGDCWRACIASILDLPASEVPNFALESDWDEMVAAARGWLAERGYSLFRSYCSAKWEWQTLLKVFSGDNPGTPIILIGQCRADPSDNHAVIVMDGEIVHDPSGAGVAGPVSHGEGHEVGWWWFDVITLSAAQKLAA